MTYIFTNDLHFLEEVSVRDDLQFLENQVDAARDEEIFVLCERRLHFKKIAGTKRKSNGRLLENNPMNLSTQ